MKRPRLYLINPDNPVVSLSKRGATRLNRYRVWKPLGLLVLAGMTPEEWDVEVLDENLGPIDFDRLPRPDLVGVTAFTSQATRAYELCDSFRRRGVPVVLGGIHASMMPDEAQRHADAVVIGEGEAVWRDILAAARRGRLAPRYEAGQVAVDSIPSARHDLTRGRYALGSIQTTRGCPLACTFCSVTAFNGKRFRHRPVESVIDELRLIEERMILFVDDNLIGTRKEHGEYSKRLFRRMIDEGLTKPWICQATINFADDTELLDLAARSGCVGVFVGFESVTEEGLTEIHKRFNTIRGRDIPASVRRIQEAGIGVCGSFILGLDSDRPGVGKLLAKAARLYGVDLANVLVLTPLPGTTLWREMESEDRIRARDFPADWQYYTLAHPVAEYVNFSWRELNHEIEEFHRAFYRYGHMARRLARLAFDTRHLRFFPFALVGNLTYRFNQERDREIGAGRSCAARRSAVSRLPVVDARIAGVQG